MSRKRKRELLEPFIILPSYEEVLRLHTRTHLESLVLRRKAKEDDVYRLKVMYREEHMGKRYCPFI